MNDDLETRMQWLISFCQERCDEHIGKARKARRVRLRCAACLSLLWLVPMCVNLYLLHYWLAAFDYTTASAMAAYQWWNWTGMVDLHRKFKREWAERKSRGVKFLEHYREHKWD